MLARRQFMASGLTAATLHAAGPQGGQHPNVLFVIVDDLNCRIGPYGDPVANTPNLDRLAARGVRFDRAYCQYPLCNPTRSSVLSGRYPTQTGVLDNNTLLVLEPGHESMPRHFANSGYEVAEFGKVWHGPNRGMRAGGAKPVQRNARTGVTVPWATPEERDRQRREEPDYWDRVHSPYRNLRLAHPEQYEWANKFGPLDDGDPGADARVADQAIAAMKKFAPGRKPFFLAAGFNKPHVPLMAPKKYFDMYDARAIPLPPDFETEAKPIEGMPPDEFRANIDLYAGRAFTTGEARQAMRAYYACVSYMDAQLGRLLDTVDNLGLANDTIVVLWGDHGWHLSEKGMWAKGTLFETSARGPLLIADPRRTQGRVSARVVQYLDLFPTLVDLCGLNQAPWLSGTSLRPLLDRPDAEWTRPAYTVQTRGWALGRSVRTERWRYTEWDQGRRGSALFDHDADPHEMRNLAQNPAQAQTVATLSKLLRQLPVRYS
ncbi:MAG: sulfatase [Bryobacteraceae bacterium]